MSLWFHVREHQKAQPAAVLVYNISEDRTSKKMVTAFLIRKTRRAAGIKLEILVAFCMAVLAKLRADG